MLAPNSLAASTKGFTPTAPPSFLRIALTLSSSLGTCGTGLNLSGSGGLNASTPPTSGSIGIFVSAASSSLLTFDAALYDLEIASGSGDSAVVTRLIEGIVKLSKNITLGGF